jgi:hypothetical protein
MPLDPAIGSAIVVFLRWIFIVVSYFLWFLVKKSGSEFPISEFRYIIYVGLSIITRCKETTRHKGPPKIIKDTLFYSDEDVPIWAQFHYAYWVLPYANS